MTPEPANPTGGKSPPTFRRAVFRGLAILMPLLVTILLFIWAWELLDKYVINYLESLEVARIVWMTQDELPSDAVPDDAARTLEDGRIVSFDYNNRTYKYNDSKNAWVGRFSEDYVRQHKFNRSFLLTFFVPLFILLLYFLGKFVAAGIGRMLVGSFESLIHRIPVISKVYASVKQVTDFVFVEREIEFNRVVAIEYPRKGIWSVGFVTGESMLDIAAAANEPVLSVLMPTSPMPMTGFTVTVRRSEAVDLNISIDEAIQFVVSCGVVVPMQQRQVQPEMRFRIAEAIKQHPGNNGQDSPIPEESQGKLEVSE